jgi:hypothetical protein
MKHFDLFAFFALCGVGLLPAELGCQTQVIGGGQGGSGGQSSGPGEPTSGPGGSAPTSGGGPTTIPALSGNARHAEGGYIVTLADYPSACKDPGVQPECGPSRWWSNQFELKSSDLVPGTVLPLSGLDGVFYQQDPLVAGQLQCGLGAAQGSFFAGTVTVLAASATELTLEVAGTEATTFMNKGTNGTYTIPICPGAPHANDGKAIALRYSETPGNNLGSSNASCTSVGGPFIDPDTLMLYISNLDQSCVDPFHSALGCITPRYQVAIQLPLNLQTVGVTPLEGLATLTLSTSGPGSFTGPGSCGGGGGSYWDGTINITSIDASGVTFTLSGTADTGMALGNLDGTYTAPRCF